MNKPRQRTKLHTKKNQNIRAKQDTIHSSHIISHPDCNNQESSSTSSAIQSHHSLSYSQVTLAENERKMQTGSVSPVSMGPATT